MTQPISGDRTLPPGFHHPHASEEARRIAEDGDGPSRVDNAFEELAELRTQHRRSPRTRPHLGRRLAPSFAPELLVVAVRGYRAYGKTRYRISGPTGRMR